MIYTLTVNPSLDYIVRTDVVPNSLNRSSGEAIYPGGKGINVSLMLANLGCESIAIATVAGRTGKMLENMLKPLIKTDLVYLENGMTRINVKAIGSTAETEINGRGVDVGIDDLKDKLAKITPEDHLVISGSFSDYRLLHKIVENVNTKKLIYDIPKIEYAVSQSPFFIKPNLAELEEYFKCSIAVDELEVYCKRLLDMQCKNILVSLGSEGAFFCNRNFVLRKKAPEGKAVNTVCSGDSMVAGVLYGMVNNMSVEESVEMAVACGSATAFCEHIAKKEAVMELYQSLTSEIAR